MTKEQALDNALASSRMEGFEITDEIKYNCERLIDGKISVTDLVKEILNHQIPLEGDSMASYSIDSFPDVFYKGIKGALYDI